MILIIVITLLIFAGLHLIISKNSSKVSSPKISKNLKEINSIKECSSDSDCQSNEKCDGPHQPEGYYQYIEGKSCPEPNSDNMGAYASCIATNVAMMEHLKSNLPSVCKLISSLPDKTGQECGNNCKPPFICITNGTCCHTDMVYSDRATTSLKCSTGNIGDRCSYDKTCSSKNCDKSFGKDSVCKPGLRSIENNEVCKDDDKCKSGACGYGKMFAKDQICCESGKTTDFIGEDYCTNMKNFEQCRTDSMCASKACGKNLPGNSAACCESGKTTDYLGSDYCAGRKKGEKCYTDTMCASDNCKGNNLGFSQGVCT